MKLVILNMIVTLYSLPPSSCHTCTLYIKQKTGIKTIHINILFIMKDIKSIETSILTVYNVHCKL